MRSALRRLKLAGSNVESAKLTLTDATYNPGPSCDVTDLVATIDEVAGLPGDEEIMRFFAAGHLPAHLRAVSQPFAEIAATVVLTLPRSAERSVTLRKLLEAKDAAVRAALPK